jgi:hypothetical protein
MISRRGKHNEDVRHRVSFAVVLLHRRRHGFTAGVAEILEQCDVGCVKISDNPCLDRLQLHRHH